MRVKVVLIAAVSEDGYISAGTGVPWDLAEDRAHFRRLTEGQWLLLGRRTFEEMTGWFRGHRPLVLTRRPLPERWRECGVRSVEEAVERVEAGGGEELWVCGGGAAYEAAMARADELILTEVRERLGGGVRFPEVDSRQWRETRRERPEGDGGLAYEWVWHERI